MHPVILYNTYCYPTSHYCIIMHIIHVAKISHSYYLNSNYGTSESDISIEDMQLSSYVASFHVMQNTVDFLTITRHCR